MERHCPTWDEVDDFTRQQSEEEEDEIRYATDPLMELLDDQIAHRRQTTIDEFFHISTSSMDQEGQPNGQDNGQPSGQGDEYVPAPMDMEDDLSGWFVLASGVLSFAGLIGRADFFIVGDNVLFGRLSSAIHPAVFVAGLTRGSFEYSEEVGGIVFDGGVLVGSMADNAADLVAMLGPEQMEEAERLFDGMYLD